MSITNLSFEDALESTYRITSDMSGLSTNFSVTNTVSNVTFVTPHICFTPESSGAYEYKLSHGTTPDP